MYFCAMLFSLVIPTYNNLPELKNCLAALHRVAGADFEVLVAVDGSTDGTVAWLQATTFPYPLQVLQHADGQNHGRSATRNLALAHLTGEYVLFMDSDMEASSDLLTQHLAVLSAGDTISIGTVSYRNTARNLWVRYTSQRGVAKYPHGAEVPFQYFITPNTALPARYVIACQGFDEAIDRYGGEDMELGYRIHLQFAPHFRFNGQAIVTTTQPKTLAEALPQLREYGATGLRYIVRKWPQLGKVYWVHRCEGRRLSDRLFALLTWRPFQWIALGLLRVTPFALQKLLINYLVVSHVHEGYRSGRY
jgi:glycosyltransferase involved in cell wall biosynthesis